MSLTALLLLTLVGGYAFSETWSPSKYHSAREEGHRLYFRSTFYAAFLVGCATCVHLIALGFTEETYLKFIELVGLVFFGPVNEGFTIWGKPSQAAILIIAFILGPLLSHILNLTRAEILLDLRIPGTELKPFYRWWGIILDHAIKDNDFEKLIARSANYEIPVLFTLTTGKVYAGWVVSTLNPGAERKAVRILPLLSGYRDQKTHRVNFMTNYHKLLNEVPNESKEDLEVVIMTEQVSSARPFDLTLYNKYFDADGVETSQDKASNRPATEQKNND